MPQVSEVIPEALRHEVDAALAWFNETQQQDFEVTGILDAEKTLSAPAPRELRLVLCGGDACLQRTFRVAPADGGYDVALANGGADSTAALSEKPAELDPPPGPLRKWLDSILPQHKFTVLLFYRGFW